MLNCCFLVQHLPYQFYIEYFRFYCYVIKHSLHSMRAFLRNPVCSKGRGWKGAVEAETFNNFLSTHSQFHIFTPCVAYYCMKNVWNSKVGTFWPIYFFWLFILVEVFPAKPLVILFFNSLFEKWKQNLIRFLEMATKIFA